MKPACATFSDSRHAVRATKISFPTQSTTENWTTPPSLGILYGLYIYRLQWNLHVRPSRIRDMLFELLKLVFLLKTLLKTGPPNLGTLYRLHIHRLQWNPHVRPSQIRDIPFKLLKLVFLLKALLNQNWTTKSLLFRRILLKASTIPTY